MSLFAIDGHVVAQTAGQPAAQSESAPRIDKRKLLVQPRNADGTLQRTPFWEDPVLWIREQQQDFYGAMSGAIRRIRSDTSHAATWTLLLLSFGYGIFHAAGPGHGKAVISAWLLATESELRRGIFIAFLSSLIQALTAVTIVSVLLLLVASVGATARNVAGVLESGSYALIAIMGIYLVWTALNRLFHVRPRPVTGPARSDTSRFELAAVNSSPGGAPVTVPAAPMATFALTSHPGAAGEGQAHHHHGDNCGCGHGHLPDASEMRGDWSLTKALSLAFAVGIRPCTGAILVLVFASALGLYWAGVASTLVMALGTFITVSVIAALAVYSRKLALRLASSGSAHWIDRLGFALRLAGGTVIAALGILLFWGSLGTVNAMM
jgi:ABC-type nickel/cobalt efflux system permease component RcnA